MIMLLILKVLGLVEYMLDYMIHVNAVFNVPGKFSLPGSFGPETNYQWTLNSVYIVPTAKGWAILDDIWTVIHNTLDMLAQFSTFFPANVVSGQVSNMGLNFPHP